MDSIKTETELNVDKAVETYKDIADRRTEINRLRGLIAGLKPWETLDIPLEMNETRSTRKDRYGADDGRCAGGSTFCDRTGGQQG